MAAITYIEECNDVGVATINNDVGVATIINELKEQLQYLYDNNPQLKDINNKSNPSSSPPLTDSQNILGEEELVISCSS